MKNVKFWPLTISTIIVVFILLAFIFKGRIKAFANELLLTYTSNFNEEEYLSNRYRLGKPEKPDTGRKYPLVIYLHGAGEQGSDNKRQIRGLKYLGNGNSFKAQEFRQKYPCFVYVPQCPKGSDWKGEMLFTVVKTIEHLISTYPIDSKRLYLVGYSMGGSGVYSLAEEYHTGSGNYFAGIVRLSGQSSFPHRVHEIVSKSALWLHIGLKDQQRRVDMVRKAYVEQMKIYGSPKEKVQEFTFDGKAGLTRTVVVNDEERVKLTEYQDIGHGISKIPFSAQNVMEWLFGWSCSLER